MDRVVGISEIEEFQGAEGSHLRRLGGQTFIFFSRICRCQSGSLLRSLPVRSIKVRGGFGGGDGDGVLALDRGRRAVCGGRVRLAGRFTASRPRASGGGALPPRGGRRPCCPTVGFTGGVPVRALACGGTDNLPARLAGFNGQIPRKNTCMPSRSDFSGST